MPDDKSISPSAQPSVEAGESPTRLLSAFFARDAADQQRLIRSLAPRILGRLVEQHRDDLLREVRDVPRGAERITIPAGSGDAEARSMPAVELAEAVLRLPFDAQQHVMRFALSRVVAEMVGPERDRFLEEIERDLRAVESGEPAAPEP